LSAGLGIMMPADPRTNQRREEQNVIHFFIGTKAQFIKMAPIMVEMLSRNLPYRLIDTGQHADLTPALRRTFALPEPDVRLYEGRDISSIGHAVFWYLRHIHRGLADRGWLRHTVFPGGGICLIHGDTLSTLLGMQLARRAGLAVGHVESGLRSRRLFQPFPEELIRMWCMPRVDLLFAPSDEAMKNLVRMGVKGHAVCVHGNTVADALRLVTNVALTVTLPDEPFALATCHLFENVMRKSCLAQVVALLNRVAERMPVVFVTHKHTRRRLERFGLVQALSDRITLKHMLGYADFVGLVKAARVVLTDGGSVQEECAYLNKPCLILRNATERPDGLGRNARLWMFDEAVAGEFLADASHPRLEQPVTLPRPSAEIVDALVELGYAVDDGEGGGQ